jgi:NAD(P)-dependent dehydrogenase (short-subunit alcohol dehydrogenase family)
MYRAAVAEIRKCRQAGRSGMRRRPDAEDRKRMVAAAADEFGRLDVLVDF